MVNRTDITKYVADHGYDVAAMTWQQITQHYASIKGSEALKRKSAQLRAKRQRERLRREQQRKRKRLADLIKQSKAVHGNRYDYTQTTYEIRPHANGHRYGYLCNIICPDHGPFDQRYDVHIKQACGCPNCQPLYHAPVEQRKQLWLARCRERFGDRFSYRDAVYVNNDKPVKIYCKEHKYLFETTPDTHVRGYGGCPYCSASEGEALIRKWLEDNNVTFDPQHQVPNENPDLPLLYLVPDFWLPDYNLFVEMNGQQHYEDVTHFHERGSYMSKRNKKWSLELQQLRDETLRKYCQDHNHNLLEIRYDQIDRIPQILKRTLKKYAR